MHPSIHPFTRSIQSYCIIFLVVYPHVISAKYAYSSMHACSEKEDPQGLPTHQRCRCRFRFLDWFLTHRDTLLPCYATALLCVLHCTCWYVLCCVIIIIIIIIIIIYHHHLSSSSSSSSPSSSISSSSPIIITYHYHYHHYHR